MAIVIDDKTYRTPLEQIEKNKDDIETLQEDVEAIEGDIENVAIQDSDVSFTKVTTPAIEAEGTPSKFIRFTNQSGRAVVTIYADGEDPEEGTGASMTLLGDQMGGSSAEIYLHGNITNVANSVPQVILPGVGTVDLATMDDIAEGITTSRGIIKTDNNLALEDDIYMIKNLIGLNSNGKTVLRTPSGFQYVLADEFDPDASYYARTRIPVDPTKVKGTWVIDEDWNPSDFNFGINATYYFVGGNSPNASDARGYGIIKNSSGWVLYNYYDVIVGSTTTYQAYPINGGWSYDARNLGIPNETSAFDGILAHCTKFSEKVLGVDADNMLELEMVSYEYTPVQLTEETFTPNTYYIIQTEYTEVLLEDLINLLN